VNDTTFPKGYPNPVRYAVSVEVEIEEIVDQRDNLRGVCLRPRFGEHRFRHIAKHGNIIAFYYYREKLVLEPDLGGQHCPDSPLSLGELENEPTDCSVGSFGHRIG